MEQSSFLVCDVGSMGCFAEPVIIAGAHSALGAFYIGRLDRPKRLFRRFAHQCLDIGLLQSFLL